MPLPIARAKTHSVRPASPAGRDGLVVRPVTLRAAT